MARTTATATTTTCRGTAVSKARPTMPRCCALRERQKRNLLATLLLSQGVPMLLSGDELGRTQHGNNNAYARTTRSAGSTGACPLRKALVDFVARLIALRREHPTFRRSDFFGGRHGDRTHGVRWLHPDGFDMSESQWHDPHARCVGMFIDGAALPDTDRRGQRLLRRPFPAAVQRPSRGPRLPAARPGRPICPGGPASTPSAAVPGCACRWLAAAATRCARARWPCSVAPMRRCQPAAEARAVQVSIDRLELA